MIFHNPTSQKLAIALAALAGFIDALGYLSLGGIFVSFMSGNSTRFAVGLTDGTPLGAALIPIGIIVLFVIGVMIGRTLRHFSPKKPSTSILVFMSFALSCAALLHESHAAILTAPLLAIAMGGANNIFFRDGEVSVGVTYMTGTLVKFGQRLAGRFLGEEDQNWRPYLLLWTGLVSGAVLGSLGYAFFGLHTLWVGIILCLILTVVSARLES